MAKQMTGASVKQSKPMMCTLVCPHVRVRVAHIRLTRGEGGIKKDTIPYNLSRMVVLTNAAMTLLCQRIAQVIQ